MRYLVFQCTLIKLPLLFDLILFLVTNRVNTDQLHKMDADEFRIYGKQMVDYVADYVVNIRRNDVLPSVEPGYLQKLLPDEAPKDPVSFQQIMDQVQKAILPGVGDRLL